MLKWKDWELRWGWRIDEKRVEEIVGGVWKFEIWDRWWDFEIVNVRERNCWDCSWIGKVEPTWKRDLGENERMQELRVERSNCWDGFYVVIIRFLCILMMHIVRERRKNENFKDLSSCLKIYEFKEEEILS